MKSWDVIKAFLAVHRAGTFEGAAQALNMDQSTVRRRIHTLEQETGVTLFTRRDGRMILVGHSFNLVDTALQMEAAHDQFLAQANTSRMGGTVRITTLDIFANLLAPDIVELHRLHPEIQVELTTEPHFVDLERERIDLAIRLARPIRGVNGLKRLADVHFGVYGAHGTAGHGAPRAGQHLLALYAHHPRMDHDFLLADERWLEEFRNGTVVARADGYTTLLRLCEEGMGLAMLPCMLANASPRLQRLATATRTIEVGVWAVIRPDVRRLPRIRTILAFLTRRFQAHAALLAGDR